MLPTIRLVGAGATPDELEQLEAEHEAATPETRESLLDRLRGISESGIREWLDDLRAANHFGTAPADEPDQDPDPVAPPEAVAAVKALLEGKPKPRAPRKPKA